MTPYTRRPRPLTAAQRLQLDVLAGRASYPEPIRVKHSPNAPRFSAARRDPSMRGKSGAKQWGRS